MDQREIMGEARFIRDHLLDGEGRLRLLPAAFYLQHAAARVAYWGMVLGLWLFPTTELIAWLRQQLMARPTIEVAAGLGELGRHLGVVSTDAYPDFGVEAGQRSGFAAEGWTVPLMRPETERLEALAAVARYRPSCVIAAWPRQKRSRQGYAAGVDEAAIAVQADYVLIGNRFHHGGEIFRLPHREYAHPWLISRSQWPEGNRLWWFQRTCAERAKPL